MRAYVIDELKALGLEPEVQRPRDAATAVAESGAVFNPWRRDVRNIVARWRGPGPAGKKALLLSAHYDSVSRGPGAGDDASGVAAILESIRALKTGPAPERDIIVLINDGEEAGLFGADVFAAEHPWAGDVGAVLNFEGRGNSGPSFMFETSEGNGWLIEQMARALPHPMASSVTYEVYRLMPNDTDLTVYKQYRMSGWNFAFVGGLYYYHSPEDTPANLDPRTLQHQGENLLAMARHLVRLDLDDVRREDVVYCSILQRFVAMYPRSWVLPLLALAAVTYLAVLAMGVAKGRIRPAEVAAGSATLLAALPAAVMAVGLLWFALRGPLIRNDIIVSRPDLGHGTGMPTSRYDVALLAGSAVVAVLVAAALFGWSGRRWSWEGLGLGALAWWLAAAAGTSLWMPGASYAFVWPLLAILAGQAAAFLRPRGSPTALRGVVAGGRPAAGPPAHDHRRGLQRAEYPAGPDLDDPGRARRRGLGARRGAGPRAYRMEQEEGITTKNTKSHEKTRDVPGASPRLATVMMMQRSRSRPVSIDRLRGSSLFRVISCFSWFLLLKSARDPGVRSRFSTARRRPRGRCRGR